MPSTLSSTPRIEALRTEVTGDPAVAWHRAGDGPPLVLLHGGHGDWRHWQPVVAALATRHTLWLPDLPGYGASGDLTVAAVDDEDLAGAQRASAALLDVLSRAIDALLGPDTAWDLAGFSFGALMAARLAARRPVRRLVLLGAAGHGTARPPMRPMHAWKGLADPAERRAALRHNLAALMVHDPACLDEDTVTVYREQVERCRFRSRPLSLAGGLQASLAAHAGPLDLVWGTEDVTAHARDLGPALVAARPGTRCHLVEGAGHWLMHERPEATARLLLDALD